MLAVPDAVRRSLLNRSKVVAPGTSDNGLFYQSTCHLFQNDINPDRFTTLDDFEEADFSGYAAGSAMTWSNAITDENGISRIFGGAQQFLATATTVTNTVYGWYVVAADGTTLLASERFATPSQVNAIGDGVALVPVFSESKEVSAPILQI